MDQPLVSGLRQHSEAGSRHASWEGIASQVWPNRHPATRPRSLAESLKYVDLDVKRILADPHAYRPEEVEWAKDMLLASRPDPPAPPKAD